MVFRFDPFICIVTKQNGCCCQHIFNRNNEQPTNAQLNPCVEQQQQTKQIRRKRSKRQSEPCADDVHLLKCGAIVPSFSNGDAFFITLSFVGNVILNPTLRIAVIFTGIYHFCKYKIKCNKIGYFLINFNALQRNSVQLF